MILLTWPIWRFRAGKQLSFSLYRVPGGGQGLAGHGNPEVMSSLLVSEPPAATPAAPRSPCAVRPTCPGAAHSPPRLPWRPGPRCLPPLLRPVSLCQLPPVCPSACSLTEEGGFWSGAIKLRSNFIIIIDLSISCAHFLLKRSFKCFCLFVCFCLKGGREYMCLPSAFM